MKNLSVSALAAPRVSFFRNGFSALALLLGAACGGLSSASADTLPLAFENLSGNSSSQVWIQFLGGDQVTGTYVDSLTGQTNQLQANTAYSLDQLVNPTTGLSTVNLTSFSGRVYVSYGAYGLQGMGAPGSSYTPAANLTTDPNYSTRYQYMEPTVQLQSDNSVTVWADLSYIDFTATSLSMSARYTSNNSLNTSVQNYNQVSSNSQALVNVTKATAVNPNAVVLPAGASSTLPNSEFTRVISPQFSDPSAYHDFTNYLNYLDGKSVHLSGTFVGTGTQPSGNEATQAQTYDFTGTFGANGEIILTAQTDSGASNVSWIDGTTAPNLGAGNVVTITIAAGALNTQKGIYGNDVGYTVQIGTGAATQYASITNDVWGRVVGDLLAGLSLGYVGSTVEFNGTPIGELASSQWWAAGESQGSTPTYLADGTAVTWADTPASQSIYFAGAQPNNPDYYNGYAAALASIDPATGKPYTTGYGFPLQDRLGNNLLSYNTGSTPGTYILLSVNADGTSALPTGIFNGSAGNGQWNDAANWVGNTVPASGASAQFAGDHTQSYTVDTQTNQTVSGLFFNYGAGTYTINNNTITLGGNIVNSSGAANTQTINSGINFSTNGSVIAAFGDIVLGGPIALSSSTTNTANTVTFSGDKNTTVNGVISDGTTAGGKVLINTTNGGKVTFNGANTFTGGLTLSQGTFVMGNDAAAGTGTFTLGNAAASASPAPSPAPAAPTLQATAARTVANQLAIVGDVNIAGSNAFTFTGDATLTNNNTITNSVATTFSGAIGESAAGTSFTKAGSANMTFSGSSANTFTGDLNVNEGKLILAKTGGAAALGGDMVIGTGSGSGATVQLGASNQTTSSTGITINTDGQLDLQTYNTTANSLTMSGGSVTGTGKLSLTSGLNFNGSDDASATISSALDLSGAQTLNIAKTSADVEVSVSGALTGTASSITKSGSGVIAFTGSNSLTGAVTITQGVLQSSSMANASLTVNGGAFATSLSDGLAPSVSVSSLNASLGTSSGAFIMALGSGGSSDSITSAGAVNLGANTVFLFRNAGFGIGSQTFTLISGVNWVNTDVSTFTFSSIDVSGLTGSIFLDGTDLKFTGTAGTSATWTGGGGDGNWSTGGNWQATTAPLAGSNIIFNNNTGTSINVDAAQTTGRMVFQSGAGAFTFTGQQITLGGDLINNSAETQTFQNTIALSYNRTFNATSGDLVFGTAATDTSILLSSNSALANTLTFNANHDFTVNGLIGDGAAAGGSIVMSGLGTLTLGAANTFSGTATLNSGITNIATAQSLGNQNSLGTNTLILNGGTLQIGGTGIVFNQFRGVNLASGSTIDTNDNSLEIDGSIYGSGDLTKSGEGNLFLNQTNTLVGNTYSGNTEIIQGSVTIGYAEALGDTTGTTTVRENASLIVQGTGNYNVTGEKLFLSGTGYNGGGALQLTVGQSTWDGDITLQGDASIQANANTKLTLGKKVDLGANALTLSAEPNGIIDLSGHLTGSGGLTVGGGGVVNVSSSNTDFTGNTTISDGTLGISSGTALGSTGSLTVDSGGMLEFQGTSDSTVTFSAISLNGTGVNSNGAIYNNSATSTTLVGNITLAGNTTIGSALGQLTIEGAIDLGTYNLSVNNIAAQLGLTGAISGSGNITTAGTSSLLLSGNNSGYSGNTTIITGTSITAASNNALGTGTTTVNSGGALMFQGGITTTGGSLNVGGAGVASGALSNVKGDNTYGGNVTFTSGTTIQATKGKLTLSGNLSNSAAEAIVVQGNGTVYFSGDASGLTTGTVVNVSSGTFASNSMSNVQINLGTGAQGSFAIPTYSPGDINNIQNVSLANISFANSQSATAGGVRLLMDLGAGTSSDQISVATASALNVPILFDFNNAGYTTGGTYTLLSTAGGAFSVADMSNLTFKSNITGLSGTFSGNNTSSITFTASTGPAVWDDSQSNGQWGDAANWEIGGSTATNVPAGGSATAFTAASAGNVDTQASRYVGGLAFQSGSAALNIQNNTITTYGDIVNNSTATQTISSGLAINDGVAINAASGNLNIGNVSLSSDGSSHILTFTGSKNTTVSGVISNGSASNGAVVKSGTGTTTWTGANTFTGTTVINGGTLVINGSTAAGNAITVASGGSLGGSGTIGGQVIVSGTLTPGNSPGLLSTASQEWRPGGNYNWQVVDFGGTAGVGYDSIAVTGSLDLSALTAGSFAINLWSLSSIGPDVNGNAANFNPAVSASWTLVSTTTGIAGFNASNFVVNTTATNGTAGLSNVHDGTFSVGQVGNNLVLTYTAVPEPSTWALLGLSLAAIVLLHRRSRRTA
ncbi:hypothetical protein DB345_00405 [Spartobacteria bacterium LR76]|nr:hypothetical protein DB345_00405 [Spartobacteria bacterium LR76]